MFARFSLRLRIFLFFALLALGGLAVIGAALAIGYRRAAAPDLLDAFVFSGLLSGFALLAMVTGVWLLFDEHVAKPLQRLAVQMRAHAHAGVAGEIDLSAARYLGDLAPAVKAVAGQLSDGTLNTAAAVAAETARLAEEKQRLTSLLTEIPVAMVLVNPAHRIVLYDGQAADLLAQIAPPRLQASLFDYLQRDAIEAAYRKLLRTGRAVTCKATSADGRSRHDLRLRPLGDAPGYLLVLDATDHQISADAPRPLVYDFDLLETAGETAIEDQDLLDLCFVVFDTETTGLLPHKDEIVQIGAVRVVRGKIIPGETLDMLVDPGIPIPASSSRVHRITDHMVAGAPDIVEAGRALHGFARDAVIVAHNAPFDMAFLHRHARPMGVTWDHPILDTVLLSAVLFGISETHTLDSLCQRLNVTIPEALRHTALGDARATAEVLCRMLPMLQARGMRSFGDVIAETRRQGRLLLDLN